MSDIFHNLSGGQIIGFAAIVGVFLWGVLLVAQRFHAQVQKTRRAEVNAALKQEMLNRGMSAEEIRTVCDAGGEHAPRGERRNCRV